jgi:hypothetical protein
MHGWKIGQLIDKQFFATSPIIYRGVYDFERETILGAFEVIGED